MRISDWSSDVCSSDLVAGYELERAGHDVIVIEARKRVGGRIFTQRDADGGVVAEAGAGRIPTSHLWTNHYIAKMGLQTKPLISDGLRTLAHVDGHSWVDGQTTLPRSEEHTSELQSLMRTSYA